MFLITLRYNQPMAQVTALQEGHMNWLKTYFAEGIFVAAGRKIPRTGGVIFASRVARDELERILAEDPFSAVADYDIIEFLPTLNDDRLSALLTL
ncbi:hypothetical protein JZM24_00140 [Candidatus Sodalis endolongispinus]|uniref:YCII-related domain-containing protein n=1 Tax=Candidatus Sodalis endolongispinus TaxID=2812662 RepID=A0ABS5Y7K5_9GAMM|nr:YciI family protein [Candidatus Sodalis endolongispinus]MBT9430978.1 hypothetical protein [Candidatus Sodalis endolongispinus]